MNEVFCIHRNQRKRYNRWCCLQPEYLDYQHFITDLEYALSTISNKKKRCFILGDFNIDLLKFNHNHQVDIFVNLMCAYSFSSCIDRPTRVCPGPNGTTSISLIDNIFTNDAENRIKSGNLLQTYLTIFLILSQ